MGSAVSTGPVQEDGQALLALSSAMHVLGTCLWPNLHRVIITFLAFEQVQAHIILASLRTMTCQDILQRGQPFVQVIGSLTSESP